MGIHSCGGGSRTSPTAYTGGGRAARTAEGMVLLPGGNVAAVLRIGFVPGVGWTFTYFLSPHGLSPSLSLLCISY